MHIGFVTDTYLPRINGVAISVERYATALRQLGHQVTIFVPDYTGEEGIHDDLWRFPSRPAWNNREDRAVLLKDKKTKALLKLAKALDLDIIHSHTPFELGRLFLKLSCQQKIPCVHTYHTWLEAYVNYYAKPIPPVIARWLIIYYSTWFCNQHQMVFTPSAAMRNKLLTYGIKQPVQVLPTGIDQDEINQDSRLDHHEPFQLMVLGRLSLEKNIEFLLKVFQFVRHQGVKAELIIAGDGPDKERLIKLCHQLQIKEHVVFSGYITGQDKTTLFKQAALHLMASRTETQGLSMMEAMAAGTMTIGLDFMGVGEILRQGAGLIAPETIEGFGRTIIEILTQPEKYEKWLEQLKPKLRQWDMLKMAEQLAAYYRTF